MTSLFVTSVFKNLVDRMVHKINSQIKPEKKLWKLQQET